MGKTKQLLLFLIAAFCSIAQANVRHIRGQAQFNQEVLQNPGPTVVMFSNRGCGPCQQIKPHYEQLAATTPGINFFGIDTEFDYPISESYNIGSIPSFLFIKNGEVLFKATDLYTPSTFRSQFNQYVSEVFGTAPGGLGSRAGGVFETPPASIITEVVGVPRALIATIPAPKVKKRSTVKTKKKKAKKLNGKKKKAKKKSVKTGLQNKKKKNGIKKKKANGKKKKKAYKKCKCGPNCKTCDGKCKTCKCK